MDEETAASHELMNAVIRFIRLNAVPTDLAESIKAYFTSNAQQKSDLSLEDENAIYRALPLATQVRPSDGAPSPST